jgi:hypothetical protein
MRCPKCGYISFDNLESCLKCNKDISDATRAFQGSTLKVTTPSFLKISVPDENDRQIEGAAEVGGEIEFADPDLEILIDDDDDQGGIDFELDADEPDDDLPLAGDFDEAATFGDDGDGDTDLSADLGQFEDVPEDDTFSFEDFEEETEEPEETDQTAMDLPEELNDISDLLPPDSSTDEEPVAGQIEEVDQAELVAAATESADNVSLADPEGDLDFSNLDFDLSGSEEAAADQENSAEQAEPEEASPASAVDMDEELDFDLDLGGLTIKADSK